MNITTSIPVDNPISPLQLHQAQLEEVAVSICINGISQAVMMVSPVNLHDFALGFVLTEGLVATPAEVLDIVIERQRQGWQLDVQVLAKTEYRLKRRRRSMAGPSGCGLCGIESINVAMSLPAENHTERQLPTDEVILQARDSLSKIQLDNDGTKGNHCAVYFDLSANAVAIREDVGRHSALDKLIGTLSASKQKTMPGFVLLSSRCSHDLVAKVSRVNIPILVTLSQPTTLAVSTARQTGLSLFSFQHQKLKRFA